MFCKKSTILKTILHNTDVDFYCKSFGITHSMKIQIIKYYLVKTWASRKNSGEQEHSKYLLSLIKNTVWADL